MTLFDLEILSHNAMRHSFPICSSVSATAREARQACDWARRFRNSTTRASKVFDHTLVLRFDSAAAADAAIENIWTACTPEVMPSESDDRSRRLSSYFGGRGAVQMKGLMLPTVSIVQLAVTEGCPACEIMDETFTLLPLLVHKLCHSGQPAISSCSQVRVFVVRPDEGLLGVVPRLLISSAPRGSRSSGPDLSLVPRRALHSMLEASISNDVIVLQTLSPDEADELMRRREQAMERKLHRSRLGLEASSAARRLELSIVLQAPNLTMCPAVLHAALFIPLLDQCLKVPDGDVASGVVSVNVTAAKNVTPEERLDDRAPASSDGVDESDTATPDVQTVEHFLFMVIDTYFVNMHVRRLGEPSALGGGTGWERLSNGWRALMTLCSLLTVVWALVAAQEWWSARKR